MEGMALYKALDVDYNQLVIYNTVMGNRQWVMGEGKGQFETQSLKEESCLV